MIYIVELMNLCKTYSSTALIDYIRGDSHVKMIGIIFRKFEGNPSLNFNLSDCVADFYPCKRNKYLNYISIISELNSEFPAI